MLIFVLGLSEGFLEVSVQILCAMPTLSARLSNASSFEDNMVWGTYKMRSKGDHKRIHVIQLICDHALVGQSSFHSGSPKEQRPRQGLQRRNNHKLHTRQEDVDKPPDEVGREF